MFKRYYLQLCIQRYRIVYKSQLISQTCLIETFYTEILFQNIMISQKYSSNSVFSFNSVFFKYKLQQLTSTKNFIKFNLILSYHENILIQTLFSQYNKIYLSLITYMLFINARTFCIQSFYILFRETLLYLYIMFAL